VDQMTFNMVYVLLFGNESFGGYRSLAHQGMSIR